jgi:hypothetical protein
MARSGDDGSHPANWRAAMRARESSSYFFVDLAVENSAIVIARFAP